MAKSIRTFCRITLSRTTLRRKILNTISFSRMALYQMTFGIGTFSRRTFNIVTHVKIIFISEAIFQ